MKHWVIIGITVASVGSACPAVAQSPHTATGTLATTKVITFNREIFQYTPAGHRDPFLSLATSTELRPTLADLRLTTVIYDPTGGNSVAILRNIGTKQQYRVKVGSTLGRMRVVRIELKTITFALEEFGFSRQETLSQNDSTRTRTP